MTHVAVLGLGTMGGRAAEQGVLVYAAADAAISAADLVLLSLPRPADVTATAAGPLAAAASGSVVADMSTIDPNTARATAETFAKANVTYLDAPVLGRPDRCGRWTLPVGGPEPAVARAAAVLEGTIAARVVRTGDVGAGSVVKLLNNLMFGAINRHRGGAQRLPAGRRRPSTPTSSASSGPSSSRETTAPRSDSRCCTRTTGSRSNWSSASAAQFRRELRPPGQQPRDGPGHTGRDIGSVYELYQSLSAEASSDTADR